MSKKKFSNKKVGQKPKPNPKIVVKKHKPKPKPELKVDPPKTEEVIARGKDGKLQKDTLFVISADYKNFEFNLKYTLNTWVKDINTKKNSYIVLCEKDDPKNNCISKNKFNYKNHTAYDSQNMKWFLTERLWGLKHSFSKVCFCTDTTYFNVSSLFNSSYRYGHWGKKADLLHPSIEHLSKINNKINPYDIKMYHAEAGFVLNIDLIKKIAGVISYQDTMTDRWDSMIAHAMYILNVPLNEDAGFNIFPYTMTGDDAEAIAKSKSYGYLKYYEKEYVHEVLKTKGKK